MSGHKWRPIEDLPDDWGTLKDESLSSLAQIWQEQKEKLGDSQALYKFNLELQRQWALETGIIEGLYHLDRGVTQLLIERGIEASLIPHGALDKSVEEVLPIIRDQETAIQGLFDFVRNNRTLSTSYFKELHQTLTAHQDSCEAYDQSGNPLRVKMTHGEWKRQPNNPSRSDGSVHEYCPPEQVASEMDRLVEMYIGHAKRDIPPDLEAAWLHHRFTQIHPFQDGNGRVARAVATLVFLKEDWFPLVVVSDEHRGSYLEVLEKADQGSLGPMTELFSDLQKEAFVQALSISKEAIESEGPQPLDAMIDAAAAKLKDRLAEKQAEMEKVFDLSCELELKSDKILRSVSERLRGEISKIDRAYVFTVGHDEEDSRHWFWNQVVQTAKIFKYYADLKNYHRWYRLRIRKEGERQTEIVVSFHSLGAEFVGVISVSAFVEYRVHDEDKSTSLDGPYTICRNAFQFSYKEELSSVTTRFEKWLNETIIAGLDQWRRQL